MLRRPVANDRNLRAHISRSQNAIAALLMGTTSLVAPKQAVGNAHAGLIRRIVVQGTERVEHSTVLSHLPIQPGDTADPQSLDLALKSLARTDLFAIVRIGMQGDTLIVSVAENPLLSKVLFEGNSFIEEGDIKGELQSRPNTVFTRAKVMADVQRIIELYRRSGHIFATVTPKVVELPLKCIDLVFEIEEGAKSGALEINFLGNSEFSDDDLRDAILVDESHWYKMVANKEGYDPDRIEYDRELLRNYYRSGGYFDFRMISSVVEVSPDGSRFFVTYTLEEGDKYKFGKVSVESSLRALDDDLLARILPIQEGHPYDCELVEQAADTLTIAAGAASSAFVYVSPRFAPDRATGVVDVVFQVHEGAHFYVDRGDRRGGAVFDSIKSSTIKEFDYSSTDGILSDSPDELISEHLWWREFIKGNSTDKARSELEHGIRAIYKIAVQDGASAVSSYIEATFPNLTGEGRAQQAALPKVAPARWAADKVSGYQSDRLPGETPPDFIRRHYGQWLGAGLTRAQLGALDPQLYTALSNWLRRNDMPKDIDLPTPKQVTDRWVDRVSSDGVPPDHRALERAAKALRSRAAINR